MHAMLYNKILIINKLPSGHTVVAYMADGQPSALGTGHHPGSKTSVGYRESKTCTVCAAQPCMRSQPHCDKVLGAANISGRDRAKTTLKKGGMIRGVAECRCTHDMMMINERLLLYYRFCF